jgi:DNA-binding NarL/FixJ family response regulator
MTLEDCERVGCGQKEAALARVLIVEDHEMLAEALSLALSARDFECTVADLDGPESVLEQALCLRPGLVLLDLALGRYDGRSLLPGLRALGAKVLVVTGCSDEVLLAEAVALGASGWVSKAEPFERLIEAAQLVHGGAALFGAARQAELVGRGWAGLASERDLQGRMSALTSRESQVLEELMAGHSAEEIAEQFVVSIGTVRTHIRGILTKLGVTSQLAAVAKAWELAQHRSSAAQGVGPEVPTCLAG